MTASLSRKLIERHLVGGRMTPGEEIALAVDQTLTQDATGTLVMLELEAMGIDRVRTELSAQYVDHNILQTDERNADDHQFLWSACRRYGLWYSPPGNGVSHPLHMQRFGVPGKLMAGSDSHTCAAGSLGMFAVGVGGLEVAAAMAGEPLRLRMPEIWGVELLGALPDWVSAKDVILEMLRRHGVSGGVGRVIEYFGPGVETLSAMDRHVIANMGQELGATTTVFPADAEVRRFLEAEGRGADFAPLAADEGARYDHRETLDLSTIEPLIATPSSPGNVVPVREVAGEPVGQAYIGSSANPGYRDFAVPAHMVAGRRIAGGVSFDVNPTSRQLLLTLMKTGELAKLIGAGARLHQAGCNGCIGMGQAPATGRNSLRTTPRNFPGRSGTREDSVYLCSPETATAAALTGRITDPRELDMPYPHVAGAAPVANGWLFSPPLPPEEAARTELVRSANIAPLPELDPPPDRLELPVLLKVGDDLSTDEILPAGARVLPYRSNIPKISAFAFEAVDPDYADKAAGCRDTGGHAVVGGRNYGQGSSREHAAIAPRFLGLRAVLAKSFSRIHRSNLVNFGVLPLVFDDPGDYDRIAPGDTLVLEGVGAALDGRGTPDDGDRILARHRGGESERKLVLRHGLAPRQRAVLRAGGMVNWLSRREGKPDE